MTAKLSGAGYERGGVAIPILVAVAAMLVGAATALIALHRGKDENNGTPAATRKSEGERNKAPGFTLKDLSGNAVKLSDFEGNVVLLNFWATWCGPCRVEIPEFIRLREQYHTRGFEIIGISLDDEDAREGVAAFARRLNINYPIVIGTAETVEAYGPMNAIPTTLILDRQGRIHSRHLGMLTYDEVEKQIKPLL